ncbi:HTH-type transcriptional regulator PrtR [compost metagenome]
MEFELEASGGLIEVVDTPDRKLRFSRETLKFAGVEPSGAAVARLTCRSMERLILEGAAIAFDMSFKHIVDGEIYAFDQAGMLRVKYLYKLPGGGIRFRSENSDEYPDEFLACQDLNRITMLGRVFWWSTVRPPPHR